MYAVLRGRRHGVTKASPDAASNINLRQPPVGNDRATLAWRLQAHSVART